MPIALAVIFAIFGIAILLLAFTGDYQWFGYDLGEINFVLGLIGGILFMGMAWEFYKRKKDAIAYGYLFAIGGMIVNIISFSLAEIIFWFFVFWLTYSCRKELVN